MKFKDLPDLENVLTSTPLSWEGDWDSDKEREEIVCVGNLLGGD